MIPVAGSGFRRAVSVNLRSSFRLKRFRDLAPFYYLFLWLLFRFSHRKGRDHLSAGKSAADGIVNGVVHFLLSGETHLSLGGMHVHVQIVPLHLHLERDKRKFVLHEKAFISVFDGFCDDIVLDISAVDIVVFKTAVASGDLRFSHESGDLHKGIFILHFQKGFGNVPSVDAVYHVFYVIVSGTVELHLFILDVFKGNLRVGKGQLLHQRVDVIGFRSIGFQKFASGRRIVKEIAHQKSRAFRRPQFFQRFFHAAFDNISGTA